MKVMITGAKGQLGIELQRQMEIRRGEYRYVGTDLPDLDITDRYQVSEFCRRERPDVIINSAALTDVDSCESQEQAAMAVNAYGAGNLSAAALEWGAKILHVSTDYVFDGSGNVPRVENDPINPINVYGRSKALGEQLVREQNPRHFIIRTAWLYGNGRNFVRTMLSLARQKDELDVVDDQIGTPTSATDLADCILGLIRTDHFGTFHGTCEGSCSWFHFAQLIFDYKGIKKRLNPITTEVLNRPARRPLYSVLENARLKCLGMNNFRSWEDALKSYLELESKEGMV